MKLLNLLFIVQFAALSITQTNVNAAETDQKIKNLLNFRSFLTKFSNPSTRQTFEDVLKREYENLTPEERIQLETQAKAQLNEGIAQSVIIELYMTFHRHQTTR